MDAIHAPIPVLWWDLSRIQAQDDKLSLVEVRFQVLSSLLDVEISVLSLKLRLSKKRAVEKG